MTEEYDNEAVDVALTLEGRMNERFDELFRVKYNSIILPRIKQMIQEESAQIHLDIGKRMGELMNSKGEI
jgi:hypothetical protein